MSRRQLQAGHARGASWTQPRQVSGRGQHAGLSRDDDALSDRRRARAGGARRIRGDRLRLARLADRHRPAGHGRGHRRGASLRSRCRRGSPRRRCRCSRSCDAGDHVLVTDAVYGPTRRFCNNHLLRLGVEVSYYDPLLGGRDRARVPAEHAPRVHRVAGLADVLRAGYSGDRRGGAPARRARRHRQFVGDAVRVSLVRPWRRRVGARRDQIHRRPFGRALGADPRERSDVPGVAPALDGHGRDRVARRLLPRAARPAHAAAASRAARRERARDCAMAADAARSARGDLSRRFPARAATSCGSAISSARRDCSRSCSSRWPRRASPRCSTACGSSAWAGAGADSRASSFRPIRSACRPPRRGMPAGRACGSRSGSKTPAT